MPPGRPSGLSIGRAFEIPPGIAHDDLREAIALIEAVHGVEPVPRIPLYGTRFPANPTSDLRKRGRFTFTPDGDPISIAIEIAQEHLILSTLHEVGHFLDLVAIGRPRRFESTAHGAILSPWQTAVGRTAAALALAGSAQSVDWIVARDAQKQLEWPELWARSYAQFIIERSGRADLARSLDEFRPSESSPVYLPLHWEDDDFDEISVCIDDVLRRQGWRTD
jgi:hypothetical protein